MLLATMSSTQCLELCCGSGTGLVAMLLQQLGQGRLYGR